MLPGGGLFRLAARRVSTLGSRFKHGRSRAQLAWDNWRKQAMRERQKVYAERNYQAKFDEWRRQHVVALVVAGGIGGAVAAGTITFALLGNSSSIERAIVGEAMRAFDAALNFDTRREIFFRLPEMTMPMPEMAELLAAAGHSAHSPLRTWANKLSEVMGDVDGSFLLSAKEKLRARLLEEAERITDPQRRLAAIAGLLPPSLEREYYFNRTFAAMLETEGWIPGEALELSQPQEPATSCVLMTNIVGRAITLFPGPTNILVFALTGTLTVEAAVARVATSDDDEAKELTTALKMLCAQYQALPPELASTLLESSVAATISALPAVSGMWQMRPTPYELYVSALDHNLVAPLATDARIGRDILTQVHTIRTFI